MGFELFKINRNLPFTRKLIEHGLLDILLKLCGLTGPQKKAITTEEEAQQELKLQITLAPILRQLAIDQLHKEDSKAGNGLHELYSGGFEISSMADYRGDTGSTYYLSNQNGKFKYSFYQYGVLKTEGEIDSSLMPKELTTAELKKNKWKILDAIKEVPGEEFNTGFDDPALSSSFAAYVKRMSVDRAWAGQPELSALGELLDVNVLSTQTLRLFTSDSIGFLKLDVVDKIDRPPIKVVQSCCKSSDAVIQYNNSYFYYDPSSRSCIKIDVAPEALVEAETARFVQRKFDILPVGQFISAAKTEQQQINRFLQLPIVPLMAHTATSAQRPTVHLYCLNNTHFYAYDYNKTLGDGNCAFNTFAQCIRDVFAYEQIKDFQQSNNTELHPDNVSDKILEAYKHQANLIGTFDKHPAKPLSKQEMLAHILAPKTNDERLAEKLAIEEFELETTAKPTKVVDLPHAEPASPIGLSSTIPTNGQSKGTNTEPTSNKTTQSVSPQKPSGPIQINELNELKQKVKKATQDYLDYSDGIWFSIFHRHGATGRKRARKFYDDFIKCESIQDAKKMLLHYLGDETNGNTHPHSFRTMLLQEVLSIDPKPSLKQLSKEYKENLSTLEKKLDSAATAFQPN